MAETEPEIVFAELVDRSSERNSAATEPEIVYASVVDLNKPVGLNRKYFRPEDLRRLSHAEFSSRRAIEGLYSGKHKTFQRGQSIEFRDYRQYLPGDPVNHVDWKVYGRTDKLFIKLFEHQAELTAHLLVDGSRSMVFRGFDVSRDDDSKYDCSCRLAAAIGFLIAKQQDRFSFGVASEGLQYLERPGSSIRYLMRVLDSMEKAPPKGTADFPSAIDELIKFSKSKDLLCVFSDLLDFSDEFLKKLKIWQQRGGEIIVFHVLHDDEISLPEGLSDGQFIDSESDEQIRVNVKSVRDQYAIEMAQFIEDCRSQCSSQGFDYNLVRTSDPYTKILQRYFSRRADRLTARSSSSMSGDRSSKAV